VTGLEPTVAGDTGLSRAVASAGLAGSKYSAGSRCVGRATWNHGDGMWGSAAWNHGDGTWGAATNEAQGSLDRSNGVAACSNGAGQRCGWARCPEQRHGGSGVQHGAGCSTEFFTI